MKKHENKNLKLQSFLMGVSHFGCFVFACFFVVALISLGELSLQKGWFRFLPETYFAAADNDRFMHLNYKLQIAKQSKNQSLTNVYLLGGSSMRESLTTDRELEMRLMEFGSTVRVFNFGSSRQSFGLGMLLSENLPPGIVVVGTNLRRYALLPKQFFRRIIRQRLWVHSDDVSLFSKQVNFPIEQNPFFMPSFSKHLNWWLKESINRLKNGRSLKRNIQTHFYDKKPRLIQRDMFFEKIVSIYSKHFHRNREFNQSALEFWVERLRQQGHRIIFLDLPFNPSVSDALAREMDQYQKMISVYSASEGIPFWNGTRNLGLEDDDFYDHCHLLKSGRKKYEEMFVKYFVEYAKENVQTL